MNRIKEFWQKSDKFLLLTLAGGAVLRLIYLWEYSYFENFNIASGADVREYFDRAVEIFSGRMFAEKPDIHGIFYPLLISPIIALTQSVAFLRAVQLLLNMAAFAGMYLLMGKYSVPQKVRRIFFGLAMFYPVLIFHQAELISESLVAPLICCILYLLHYMRNTPQKELLYSAFAGVFASFAVLTHGSMLLMALLFALELFREKRRKCAAIFLGLLVAVTGVFVIAKSLHYGKFCFVQANGGFNFYLGNSAEADGTCRLRPGLAWRRLHLESEKEAEKLGVSTDRLFIGKSLKYFAENPAGALYGFCRKAVMFFHYKELIAGADPEGLVYRTKTVYLGRFFTLIIMLFAVAGVFIACRKREKIPIDFVIVFIAVFAVNVLTVASGRYRVAAYPSLYLFAAYALAYIPLKVTAIVSVICTSPAFLLDYGKTLDNESCRILGEAAYRRNDYDTAFRYLSQIAGYNDDPSGVQNMLGNIMQRRNDFQAARECYKSVISLEPERYEAYMNLADLTPDPKEADKLFKLSFANGGENSGVLHVNYAKFLLRNGNISLALEFARRGTQLLPENADAWNTLAVAYAYSQKLHLACEAFDAASKLAPENEGYRRNAQAMRQELQRRRQNFMRRRRGR